MYIIGHRYRQLKLKFPSFDFGKCLPSITKTGMLLKKLLISGAEGFKMVYVALQEFI